MQVYRYRLPPITLLAVIIEIAVITFFGITASKDFSQSDPSLILVGGEAQWLTSSGFTAAQTYREDGYISLWQPWIARGQPLIDEPFSFVLNPISTLPSFLYGGGIGIRVSVVLYAIFAGIGGWLLGRVLGFGWLARVVLGLLCIGKGNMHTTLSAGFFQLGVTQAYLPWITASAIATLRLRNRRWPIVSLALMFTLMFWGGNIYYTLPALIMIVLLTLSHTFYFPKKDPDFADRKWNRSIAIDWSALRRMLFAGALTLGLATITFIPIFVNQAYIGGHPNVIGAGTYADLGFVIQQFFNSKEFFPAGTWHETYYNYILPLWFATAIFVLLPPIYPWLHQPANPRQDWRIWAVGIVIIIFFTLWGAGLNPIVDWMYQKLPLLGQWRTVSRMLTISSLWIAIIAAMRIDGLWQTVNNIKESFPKVRGFERLFSQHMASMTMKGLVVFLSFIAVLDIIGTWSAFGSTDREDSITNKCISWLRSENPTKELSVYTTSYFTVYPYLRNHVRHAHINAEYQPMGITPTIFPYSLLDAQPEYFLAYLDDERAYAKTLGYHIMEDSPIMDNKFPCLWQKPDVLSYAFSLPGPMFDGIGNQLPVSSTTPINSFERHTDRIALAVSGIDNAPLVVVVQELAWPGWRVTVDGLPTKLESIGQLIGVVLPPGTTPHYIVFQYVPPLFILGGIITLITALVCILYLLRADRFIPQGWREYYTHFGTTSWARFKKILTDPYILSADE